MSSFCFRDRDPPRRRPFADEEDLFLDGFRELREAEFLKRKGKSPFFLSENTEASVLRLKRVYISATVDLGFRSPKRRLAGMSRRPVRGCLRKPSAR